MSKELQLKIYENIKNNYNCKMIINDNEPYLLLCLRDIGKIIGLQNINETIKKYDNKIILNTSTNGGNQNCVFLTYNNLLKILIKSRKSNVIDFATKIGIDIESKIFTCIEADTLKCITSSFDGEDFIYQYSIDKYLLDLYFPKYKLIIECDENKHNNKNHNYNDIHREKNIKLLIKNCIFIRYSPESKNFNIFNVINKIYKEINMFKYEFDNKHIEELRLKTEELKEKNEKLSIEKEKIELEKNKIELEKEQIKLKQKEIDIEIKKMELEIFKNTESKLKIDSDSDSESESDSEEKTTYNFQIKPRKNGIRTPKVYQYNPSDLKNPIIIFDSPSEVERTYPNISLSPLKNSYKNNTIYKDFRWLFLNRNENIPESIPETEISKYKSPDIKFLAMIDIKKTKILNVFCNQKEAVNARNLKSNSFTRAIKQDSISSGHYWKFFDDCPQEMKDAYFASGGILPEKYVAKTGKSVQQIDPKTDEIIAIYHSNREIIKKFQMSVITLKQSSESGNIHNGYRWKIIG